MVIRGHLDRHAVGVGAEGGGGGAGIGNGVGAGFTDVDLGGRDVKLPTRHLTGNKGTILYRLCVPH